MSRPPTVVLAAILTGAVLTGGAVSTLLLVLLSPFGSASPEVAPPTIWRSPDTAPQRSAVAGLETPPSPATESDPATPAPPQARDPGGCQGATGADLFADAQVLSYYGNPYTADMGILGELPPQALVEKLTAHARLYDSLNGPLGVQPALHLVYATAQRVPGRDGLSLLYVDDETLRQYIDLACENGLLIFLDLQIGHSDAEAEITKILPYLEQPHVQVALDPEFAMPPGESPGDSIGSLDATDVNAAQALLQGFVEERDLPAKVLVVHQFTDDMVTRGELIEDYPRVKLVIDMDGFGPSDIKRVKYGWFAAPAEHSGIKLFFRQDTDLMSEEEVLELEPDLIIYQ